MPSWSGEGTWPQGLRESGCVSHQDGEAVGSRRRHSRGRGRNAGLPARLARIASAVFALLLASSAEVLCQDRAIVAGTVTDTTGAAVPSAEVTATNETTGIAKSVRTNQAGHYEFDSLPAGIYTFAAKLPGFETGVFTSVELHAGRQDLPVFILELSPVDTVVEVGSRARPRSVTASTVPIDVISTEDVLSQGETSLDYLLRTVVPSFNVNTQPIGDEATLSRPTNLRGLAPDHTLVLVNGKRRHRSGAIKWWTSGVNQGGQGPDISTIPAIALRQVEVLRDGASAQYGSDAIAGVLNFLLKDASSGGSLEIRSGVTGAGDGEAYTIAGNAGLPLGGSGFANLSLEYGNSNPTSRSVQRNDAARLIAAGNQFVASPAQIWGSPEVDNDVKLWGNFGSSLSDKVQLYAHANYATKRATGGFYFRNPNTRDAVYSIDGGRSLLIGDALDARDGVPDGSAGCPTVAVINDVPEPAALGRVFEDPDCFSFQELFPGGFTPQFGGTAKDASVVGGVRLLTAAGGVLDFSASVGSNDTSFFIRDTVNASLGPETPTSFDLGSYEQQEINLNADVSHPLSETLNLAGGTEWRRERFETGLGQEESWTVGPYAAQGFSAASNGFPGFGPLSAGIWTRDSVAAYGDIELHSPTGAWTLGGAARLESFEDFGTTLNGKLSGRVQVSDPLAIRASVSTGFRAPTPAQQNAFDVQTNFDLTLKELVNDGTVPPNSSAAALRGGGPLKPESSVNWTAGAVFEHGGFSVTADLFRIVVSDRIVLTGFFKDLSTEEAAILDAQGVGQLSGFRFFTNDLDTRTAGVDLIATYKPPALRGRTTLSFVLNHTDTAVTAFDPNIITPDRIKDLEEALPRTRWNAGVKTRAGKWSFLGRLNYFAGWWDWLDEFKYDGGNYLVDLELAYNVTEAVTVAAGAQNALNYYPQENPVAADALGNRYSQYTPFGFNGGFYYVRLKYNWGQWRW